MNYRSLLLIPMFLLIFGPKTSGWIDVVSITSAGLVLLHFLFLNTAHVPTEAKHRAAALTTIFVLLLACASVHFMTKLDANTYQVLRFGRILVNFFGVLALVSMYYRMNGSLASQVIVRHLFHCLVFHAMVMTGMFFSPPFRDCVVNQIVQADPDSRTYLAKATGYRIAGLTDSWDALSGLQSLGLLMLPILLTRTARLSYVYVTAAIPLLLFSVAISGRTGFVTLGLLLPLSARYVDWRRVHRATLVAVAVSTLGALLLLGPLRGHCIRAMEDTSLGRTAAMFGLNYSTGHQPRERITDTFSGILSRHYFLPDDWRTTLVGTGGSGRDTWDYVPADNGLVLNIHNLGIGCFALIYGSLAWMAVSGMSVGRTHPQLGGICALAIALVVLIDIKVMYVFSRNGFSIMLIPVLAAWWELASVSTAVRHGSAPATGAFSPLAARPMIRQPIQQM